MAFTVLLPKEPLVVPVFRACMLTQFRRELNARMISICQYYCLSARAPQVAVSHRQCTWIRGR